MAVSNVIVTNDGAIDDLDTWRANLNAGSVRLFANNFTPLRTSVPADFVESSFVGYAPISPANFGAAFLNAGGKAESDSAVLTWTFTAGVGTATVFGWYLTNLAGTKVLLATKFIVPVILSPAAPNLSRTIQATAVSEL